MAKISLKLGLVAVMAMSAAASDAHADVVWSTAASGCVPAPQYAARLEMDPVFGTVKYAPGQSGAAILTCPVTATITGSGFAGNQLWTTFSDSDGLPIGVPANTECWLSSTLFKDSRLGTASWLDLAGIQDGKNGAGYWSIYNNTVARQQALNSFTHTFSNSNVYWVAIELFRPAGSTCNVTVYSVGIDNI